jgi:hypothetical protein
VGRFLCVKKEEEVVGEAIIKRKRKREREKGQEEERLKLYTFT